MCDVWILTDYKTVAQRGDHDFILKRVCSDADFQYIIWCFALSLWRAGAFPVVLSVAVWLSRLWSVLTWCYLLVVSEIKRNKATVT